MFNFLKRFRQPDPEVALAHLGVTTAHIESLQRAVTRGREEGWGDDLILDLERQITAANTQYAIQLEKTVKSFRAHDLIFN